jgi:putative acetyltransferase
MAQLIQTTTTEELQLARELFREYAAAIGVDLCFQNFEEELRTLPGKYAPPTGRLYLLSEDGEAVGCAALREIDSGIAEMKRLYVRPQFRGRGFARMLAKRLIDDAREIGYGAVCLDTLASMEAARALYASLGFRPAPAYYENPLADVCYMRLELGDA